MRMWVCYRNLDEAVLVMIYCSSVIYYFMSSILGSESWNEGLKLVSFCPICETRYNPMEARMLGKQADAHLLYIQCRKCEHSILALVLVNQVGASSIGLLTDLAYEDILRLRSHQKVTIDDVIATHALLESNDWENVLGVFSEKKKNPPVLQKREKKEQKNKATR